MTDQRCNNCRFWSEDMTARDPNDADWGYGSCRRRQPVLIAPMVAALIPAPGYTNAVQFDLDIIDTSVATRFPATFATDWCGEYKEQAA